MLPEARRSGRAEKRTKLTDKTKLNASRNAAPPPDGGREGVNPAPAGAMAEAKPKHRTAEQSEAQHKGYEVAEAHNSEQVCTAP